MHNSLIADKARWKRAEDECASGSQFPADSGFMQAHFHHIDTHIHGDVWVHQKLKCYHDTHFQVWYKHNSPDLHHVPKSVRHSPYLSIGLWNNGSCGQRDEQIIWLRWGMIVRMKIRLTGKCPRCYILDNEYAEGVRLLAVGTGSLPAFSWPHSCHSHSHTMSVWRPKNSDRDTEHWRIVLS